MCGASFHLTDTDRQKPLWKKTIWKKPHVEKRHTRKNHSRQEPINLSNINTNHIMLKLNCYILTALQFNNKDQMRKDSRSNWAKPTLKAAFFLPEENFLPCQVLACLRMHLPRENRGRRRQKSGRKPENHENGRNQN